MSAIKFGESFRIVYLYICLSLLFFFSLYIYLFAVNYCTILLGADSIIWILEYFDVNLSTVEKKVKVGIMDRLPKMQRLFSRSKGNGQSK